MSPVGSRPVGSHAQSGGMRITLVSESFHPAVDGTTRTLKAVADRLIDLGHQVQLVAAAPGLASYRRCPVVRVGPRRLAARQVRRGLTAFAPDLVHVLGRGPVSRVVLAEAGAQRLAVLTLGPREWQPGVDPAAFTPALRDRWLHQHWSRARSRGGDPLVVVGFAGRLEADHGVRRLAELATVPGVRPVVIGDGPLRGRLQARLPGARFTGELGTGDLAVALATLDVLVHPGRGPGCCNVLREAAASGVPVVAPETPADRSVLRNLETGLRLDRDSPGALARAVATVAADPHRRLLGECGRVAAARRDWRVAVGDLLEEHYPRARSRRAGVRADLSAA